MNLQKFTVKAQEAVQQALEIAQSKNHQGIEPAHLLKAFLQDEGGLVLTLLDRLGANADTLSALADRAIEKLPTVTGASVSGQYIGTDLNKAFDAALKEAEALGDDYVATEHLLMALADGTDGVAARNIVRKFQLDLIAGLAKKLQAVPEGNGNMLDNTLIVLLSDAGQQHHANYR